MRKRGTMGFQLNEKWITACAIMLVNRMVVLTCGMRRSPRVENTQNLTIEEILSFSLRDHKQERERAVGKV